MKVGLGFTLWFIFSAFLGRSKARGALTFRDYGILPVDRINIGKISIEIFYIGDEQKF